MKKLSGRSTSASTKQWAQRAGIAALLIGGVAILGASFHGAAPRRASSVTFSHMGPFGDAKVVPLPDGQPCIVGARGGKLYSWLPSSGGSIVPTNIAADWLATAREVTGSTAGSATIIVAASAEAERGVRLYRLTCEAPTPTVLGQIPTADTLTIDPVLIQAHGRWFVAYTEITGTVNRSEPGEPPGRYTVVLTESFDLRSWVRVATVLDRTRNIEDPRLLAMNGEGGLALLFEQEELNGGPSELRLIASPDGGKRWGNEIILIADGHDNEPGALLPSEDGVSVYFSSDKPHTNRGGVTGNIWQTHHTTTKTTTTPAFTGWGELVRILDVVVAPDGSSVVAAVRDDAAAMTLLVHQTPPTVR